MRIFILLSGFLFSGVLFGVLLEGITTKGGRLLKFDFMQRPVTLGTRDFLICSDQIELVKKVKLWMSEHGHGTTPTLVGDVQDGCRRIERVNFTMKGTWEIRVELSDGDLGVLNIDVE